MDVEFIEESPHKQTTSKFPAADQEDQTRLNEALDVGGGGAAPWGGAGQEGAPEARPDADARPTSSPTPNRTWIDELLETLLLAAVLFLVINVFTGRYQVFSFSMEPTLHEGEYVLALKAAYWFSDPQRGDVVVFRPLDGLGKTPYIKRVIGLPGDEVEARDGRIWINGKPIDEPYIAQPLAYTGRWTVPEGTYFVLGDNRNNSSDSHAWGVIPRSHIIAKAVFRYWPFQRMGVIRHYVYEIPESK